MLVKVATIDLHIPEDLVGVSADSLLSGACGRWHQSLAGRRTFRSGAVETHSCGYEELRQASIALQLECPTVVRHLR